MSCSWGRPTATTPETANAPAQERTGRGTGARRPADLVLLRGSPALGGTFVPHPAGPGGQTCGLRWNWYRGYATPRVVAHSPRYCPPVDGVTVCALASKGAVQQSIGQIEATEPA